VSLVVPLYIVAVVGCLVPFAWILRISALSLDASSYIAVITKLVAAGNLDRARKLSMAAGDRSVANMAGAMLDAMAEMPYDDDVLIGVALREAFDNARAVEVARYAMVLPTLIVGVLMCAVSASIAFLTTDMEPMLLIGNVAACVFASAFVGKKVREIHAVDGAAVQPIVEALLASRRSASA
jgi:hypothetical protein